MSANPWLDVALKERGVREIPGRRDNARIEEYLETTTYPLPNYYIDEIPWCSAFANFCYIQCGIRGTNSAWSQSWLSWGREVDEQVGALVIFHWGGNRGHVSFIYQIDEDGLFCCGGNQSDSVCLSYFSRNNIVGYRLPEV